MPPETSFAAFSDGESLLICMESPEQMPRNRNYDGTNGAAEETAEVIRTLGRRALTVNADISKFKEAKSMVEKAVDEQGCRIYHRPGIRCGRRLYRVKTNNPARPNCHCRPSLFMPFLAAASNSAMCSAGSFSIIFNSSGRAVIFLPAAAAMAQKYAS